MGGSLRGRALERGCLARTPPGGENLRDWSSRGRRGWGCLQGGSAIVGGPGRWEGTLRVWGEVEKRRPSSCGCGASTWLGFG